MPKYSTWEYDDKSSEQFCEYTPFMFAFVHLIIQWVVSTWTTVSMDSCRGQEIVITDRNNQQDQDLELSLRLPMSTFH